MSKMKSLLIFLLFATTTLACSITNAQHAHSNFDQMPDFQAAYLPERIVTIPAGETFLVDFHDTNGVLTIV